MAERNNILHKTITWLTVFGLIITAAGLVWRTSAQNSKLDTVCAEQERMREDVEKLKECAIELKTKVDNLIKQLDNIDRKLARNMKNADNNLYPKSTVIE